MSKLTLKFSPQIANILKVVAAKKNISKRKYGLGVVYRW